MRRPLLRLPLVLLLSFACATVVWAFSSGPVASRTGARAVGSYGAESNCTQCHSSFPLNDPNGMVQILFVPPSYVPGVTYSLRVRLTFPPSDTLTATAPKWGFQMTAVKATDGTGAGAFVTPPASDSLSRPDSLQIKTPASGPFLGSGRQYIEHTTFSTRTGQPSPAEWNFSWTAPATDVGKIYFFAAGNAGNGDGSSSGDHIFTTSDSTVAVTAVAQGPAASLMLAAPRPNPAHGSATFDFALPRAATIDLAIFDAQGRRVRTLASGDRAAGAASVRWDGRSEGGAAVPAGTYFARLRAGAGAPLVRRFTLAR